MSQYGVLLNGFWEGETGRAIAAAGGTNAQVAAVYLMQNPDANMIGLYQVRLSVVQVRIATVPMDRLERAMGVLAHVDFAYYDRLSQYVWVREMAKFRLGINREPLKPGDKRVIGAQKLYASARPNPFLEEFFKRYRRDLHLSKRRTFKGPSEVLGSPFEAPSKPENSDQGSEITEQRRDQADQEQRADARDSFAVLVKLAHGVFDDIDHHRPGRVTNGEALTLSDAKDELKTRAAQARIDYDGDVIRRALDSAEAQRSRRRSA